MSNINRFNDYMSDLILENMKVSEMVLLLSDELKSLIQMITHPISDQLLLMDNSLIVSNKVTMLSVDKSNKEKLDNISFFVSNKLIEKLIKKYDLKFSSVIDGVTDRMSDKQINSTLRSYIIGDEALWNDKSKSITSLGKIINKLYPGEFPVSGEPGKDIESFVNEYKALRLNDNVFELVNGDDITKWYNESNYSSIDQGTLHSSCMRYEKCSGYIDFYAQNPEKVSLLILKDLKDETKIRGRALVWTLDEPEDRIYMDRIYTVHDYDIVTFKKYASDNGWIYKKNQNMSSSEDLIDTKNDNNTDIRLITVNDFVRSEDDEFPYMDTLKYYDKDNDILSNDKNSLYGHVLTLENTDGGPGLNGEWSEYYQEFIDIEGENMSYCEWGDGWRYDDDCYYSDKYGICIANDYAEENLYECDSDSVKYYHDRYRTSDDCVKVGNTYYDNEWASEHLYWSDVEDDYLEEDDAVWSEQDETYLDINKSTEVYLDVNERDTDWRQDDDKDDNWFEWDYNDKCYDSDVSLEDLREEYGLDENDEEIEEEEEEEESDNTVETTTETTTEQKII